MYNVDIRTLPRRRLIVRPHIGPYATISTAFSTLSSAVSDKGLWPKLRAMVGVYHDDPAQVPQDKLRSHAGFELAKGARVPAGFEIYILPAGRAAVLHLRGPYTGLPAAYHHLYSAWLVQTGEVPGDASCFEVYLNSPMDTAPEDLLTEVCLPLA